MGVLRDISDRKLKKILNECYAEIAIGSNKIMRNLLIKFRMLKRWNIEQFVENGQQHIFSAFNCFMSKWIQNRTEFNLEQKYQLLFCVASAFSLSPNQHKNATIFYVLSVVSEC